MVVQNQISQSRRCPNPSEIGFGSRMTRESSRITLVSSGVGKSWSHVAHGLRFIDDMAQKGFTGRIGRFK